MLKKTTLAAAALAMGMGGFVPVGDADAQRRYRNHSNYDQGYHAGRRDSRRAQKCKDGDGGLLIGAIAGGLLGRTVDTRGDRTLGTLLGAGAGAFAGRAIDRSDRPGYCRR